jgi:hypothetical protein
MSDINNGCGDDADVARVCRNCKHYHYDIQQKLMGCRIWTTLAITADYTCESFESKGEPDVPAPDPRSCEWCGERLQDDGTCELKCSASRDGYHPSLEEISAGMPDPKTSEIQGLENRLDIAVEALRRIVVWEFPATGQYWPNTDGSISDRPMSYGSLYGSNGERDFMRRLAQAALELVETPGDPHARPAILMAERMATAIVRWSKSFKDVSKTEYELNCIADALIEAGYK